MDAEVIVAGAGPVGLMLAAELAARGVDTAVLEARTELYGGAANGHARQPLPPGHFAGLARRPTAATPAVEPTARMLAARAVEFGATVHRGCAVEGFTQDEDGVTVRLADGAPVHTVRAAYLIGCDGAHSRVREAAGIAFPGTGPTLDTIDAEVRLTDPDEVPSGWIRTPHGCAVVAVHPDGGFSRVVAIDFTRPAADRCAPVGLDEVAATVGRILGRPVPMAELRAGHRYGDVTRQAERYRDRRVFLAGDSAHIHYPVCGRGLDLGLQDAANLAWKLAGHLAGWAPPGLLDTYHAERYPIAAAFHAHTRAQTALLHPDERLDPVRALFAELIRFAEVDRFVAAKGADGRYDPGAPDAHPLAGRLAADIPLGTTPGRGPVLLDLSDDPEVRAAAAGWADRVSISRYPCPARPDLAALLVRPDGYVAWAAGRHESPARRRTGLLDALRRWFGEPTRPRTALLSHC
jgi:2-polyprenyl-6-methoxyphenol hydroxylase-like FAD-dependent oxidoreductase